MKFSIKYFFSKYELFVRKLKWKLRHTGQPVRQIKKHKMMMMMMMMMILPQVVFVVWLTDERPVALFPAGTIVKDPHCVLQFLIEFCILFLVVLLMIQVSSLAVMSFDIQFKRFGEKKGFPIPPSFRW